MAELPDHGQNIQQFRTDLDAAFKTLKGTGALKIEKYVLSAICIIALVYGAAMGGTVLQVVLRYGGAALGERAAVEAALVATGVINIYRHPPGAANDCKNWVWFMGNGMLVVAGVVCVVVGVALDVAGVQLSL